MTKKFLRWEEFEKSLNLTPEQEEQIRFEEELIEATIKAEGEREEEAIEELKKFLEENL